MIKYVGADYVLEVNDNGLIISKNDEFPNGEMFLWQDIERLFRQIPKYSYDSDYEAMPKSIEPKVVHKIKVKIGEIVQLEPIDFT